MSEDGADSILRLSAVSRSFERVKAVDRLSIAIERGEFVTLLGPSGCGKTTALRLVAGFETPDSGGISFAGQDVTGWSPQRRGFGMVFQNYALFPHLNVFENVAFGLHVRKLDAREIRTRVSSVLEIVDLAGYGERAVQALSGGQQQRVALARALAIEPPLLLLDEPLSNLDQALRVQTRNDLRRLVKELGITAVFVTHDQEEAFDLSDRIAVMNAGRIHQIDSPRHLYEEPADRFVAGFVGRANVLPVRVLPDGVRLTDRVVWMLPSGGSNRVELPSSADAPACSLLIRPEDLRFVEESKGEPLSLPLEGLVRDRRFRGGFVSYQVELQGVTQPTGRIQDNLRQPVVVELMGTATGPIIGAQVLVAPTPTARLHVFLDEPAQ